MVQLHNENCIPILQQAATDSIDLILTDPPYGLGTFMRERNTNLDAMRPNFFATAGWDDLDEDEWEASMDTFFREAARVVRKRGAFIVFMSIIKVETFIKIATRHGLYYKTTGIWHKSNPMPRNMNLHFINSTETWVYFINNKKTDTDKELARTGTFNNDGVPLHDFIELPVSRQTGRPEDKHPTQKPVPLMEFFIKTLSNPGDTVMDPFMGSGTTAVAAINLQRNVIGAEIRADYFKMAQKRTALLQKK
ncbi:MAG: site-specific DNA-methyltransferase [Defluviitaleaceae bacterium]|nr:site-specific DNA-methyltransferase [Defluviitaleaceae bacterium]